MRRSTYLIITDNMGKSWACLAGCIADNADICHPTLRETVDSELHDCRDWRLATRNEQRGLRSLDWGQSAYELYRAMRQGLRT